jgi:hypothetical protein
VVGNLVPALLSDSGLSDALAGDDCVTCYVIANCESCSERTIRCACSVQFATASYLVIGQLRPGELSIQYLLMLSSPSTVPWFIIPIRLFTVQRHPGGSFKDFN